MKEYVSKQALQATVTFTSTLELEPRDTLGSNISSFVEYLRGFRGPGVPQSAEKVAIATLHNQGVVVLSAPPAESSQLCCEFAPGYAHQ